MKIIGKLSDGRNLASISNEELIYLRGLYHIVLRPLFEDETEKRLLRTEDLANAFGIVTNKADLLSGSPQHPGAPLPSSTPSPTPPIRPKKKKRGRPPKTKWPQKLKGAVKDKSLCVICGEPAAKGKSKTCGKPECKGERQRAYANDWYARNKPARGIKSAAGSKPAEA